MLIFVALSGRVWSQDAPFGFSWGPPDAIPKPKIAEREANVTTLFYDRDQAFAGGIDTDQILVEICETEGLQQVIWIGRRLPVNELRKKFDAAHQRFVFEYGSPRPFPILPNAETWKDDRVFLGMSKGLDGQQRLIISLPGEPYKQCSSEHLSTTGHDIGAHLLQLMFQVY